MKHSLALWFLLASACTAPSEVAAPDAVRWGDAELAGCDPPPPPPVAVAGCTADAQCGGGDAMCLVDRCVTVSETSVALGPSQRSGPPSFAYDPAGVLRMAHLRTFGSMNDVRLLEGPWGGAATERAVKSDQLFVLDGGLGLSPVLADGTRATSNTGVRVGAAWIPVPQNKGLWSFAYARGAAAKEFLAVATGFATKEIWFTSRPAGGAWASLTLVGTASAPSLAVHPRTNGGADIVVADEFGPVRVLRKPNPIDPWVAEVVTTPISAKDPRVRMVSAHGKTGTTHLVVSSLAYTMSASQPDITATYVELGDAGPVRTVPLGTYPTQWGVPFPDLAADAAGNVWIQRVPSGASVSTAVRIDPAGNVAERSLGMIAKGSWAFSRIAIAPGGELALVHGADLIHVYVRRFTP